MPVFCRDSTTLNMKFARIAMNKLAEIRSGPTRRSIISLIAVLRLTKLGSVHSRGDHSDALLEHDVAVDQHEARPGVSADGLSTYTKA